MKFSSVFFGLFFLLSCSQNQPIQEKNSQPSPYDHISDEKVKEVLSQAIAYAGGWDTWAGINTLQYTKRSVLFLSDSSVESDVIQYHDYNMSSGFEAAISWNSNSDAHQIVYSKENVIKMVNDKEVEADSNALSQSVMGALFVLGMPFKLLDQGVTLTYEGTTLFKDSVEADIINASYSPEENVNHSANDLWWFYFEKNTGHFLGSKVYHTPTYALIRNLSFTQDVPIKFPAHRKSYRVDSLGQIEFLRAEFWYSDFKMD